MGEVVKNRIKIYLLKDSTEKLYIKERIKVNFDSLIINGGLIYYRKQSSKTPKWFKNFFNDNQLSVSGETLNCYFDKTINYIDKDYKFVISFGGADVAFDLSKFVDDFGLKVSFNICEKFVSVQKNNISTTMSNNKEYATKKDEFSSFVVDKNNDLLNKVTVSTSKNNEIFFGNVTGGVDLSLTSSYTYSNIDELLYKVIELYFSENYKEKYDFINNIKSIEKDKILLDQLKSKIIDLIINKEFSKVWFGLPLLEKWERKELFKVYSNSNNIKEYDDINIEDISENFNIVNYKDLRKIRIIPVNSDGSEDDYIYLSECLYGEIEFNGNNYVVNGERFYNISKDYATKINKSYKSIQIYKGLPERNETGCEAKYNESVEKRMPEKYKNLDQKLYHIGGNSIELCDLIDIKDKVLIHVKKYGASSVLSHLFSQALNSASLIKNEAERLKIIDFFKNKYGIDVPNYEKYDIVMAIITKEKLGDDEYLNIPFFSKMSIVTVAEKLQLYGYTPKISFIHSSVELKEKK